MTKENVFERELNLIQDEDYRKFVKHYMEDEVADYFYTIGASSTGKYHPQFAQGDGGLVRHTKAVVMFAEELLRMSTYSYMPQEYKDYVIMACIMHDTCKYGKGIYNKDEYPNHAHNAASVVNSQWYLYFGYEAPMLLTMAIASHMGQWTENKNEKPFTPIDRLVHLADYLASRSFIDIPSLTSYDD